MPDNLFANRSQNRTGQRLQAIGVNLDRAFSAAQLQQLAVLAKCRQKLPKFVRHDSDRTGQCQVGRGNRIPLTKSGSQTLDRNRTGKLFGDRFDVADSVQIRNVRIENRTAAQRDGRRNSADDKPLPPRRDHWFGQTKLGITAFARFQSSALENDSAGNFSRAGVQADFDPILQTDR